MLPQLVSDVLSSHLPRVLLAYWLYRCADASRLLARGSSAARLREEKLERRVKRELPALLKKLREQVKEWEAGTGRAFLVQGELESEQRPLTCNEHS